MATFKTTNEIEDGSLDLSALTQITTGQLDVSTSAVEIATSAPTGRKSVAIKNMAASTQNVYVGPTSGVLTTTGWELVPGESIVFDIDETQDVYAIATSGTQRVCWSHIK